MNIFNFWDFSKRWWLVYKVWMYQINMLNISYKFYRNRPLNKCEHIV